MPSRSLAGLKVLVLEDDYYQAQDIQLGLVEAGAAVQGPFADAAGAMASIIRDPPGCAVIDVNLGDGPDFSIARALATQHVPIVFVTGYDDVTIPPEFDRAPRVRKPTLPEHVAEVIRELLAA